MGSCVSRPLSPPSDHVGARVSSPLHEHRRNRSNSPFLRVVMHFDNANYNNSTAEDLASPSPLLLSPAAATRVSTGQHQHAIVVSSSSLDAVPTTLYFSAASTTTRLSSNATNSSKCSIEREGEPFSSLSDPRSLPRSEEHGAAAVLDAAAPTRATRRSGSSVSATTTEQLNSCSQADLFPRRHRAASSTAEPSSMDTLDAGSLADPRLVQSTFSSWTTMGGATIHSVTATHFSRHDDDSEPPLS